MKIKIHTTSGEALQVTESTTLSVCSVISVAEVVGLVK